MKRNKELGLGGFDQFCKFDVIGPIVSIKPICSVTLIAGNIGTVAVAGDQSRGILFAIHVDHEPRNVRQKGWKTQRPGQIGRANVPRNVRFKQFGRNAQINAVRHAIRRVINNGQYIATPPRIKDPRRHRNTDFRCQ